MFNFFLYLGFFVILFNPINIKANTLCNPNPMEDDLIISGPNETCFVFRPILIKSGSDPLSGTRFIMGDPSSDFRAPPTAVVVGGSFSAGQGDSQQQGWIYYLGKYEITEAQFDSVMGIKQDQKPRFESNLPVTNISWFEAQNFVDKLNTWLYKNALDELPTSGPFPAFVRMPTEIEWEYAARGGASVDASVFDEGCPYEELSMYEWFSGPTSSHNKIQPIGKLKPNPLGLHDMLGNIREMTSSHYQIEYYQGRSGGFAARGGHYLISEDDIHAALRTEEPYYLGSTDKGMRPNTKPTMGFRILLAAPILTDRDAIEEMEVSWEEHRSSSGSTMPAALSVSPVSDQEAVPASDALVRLERIREVLKKSGLDKQYKNDIDGTAAALQNMALVRKKADEDSARVWAKIACERGIFLSINLRGLELTKDAPTEKLKQRAEQFEYNVTTGLENYCDIMKELIKLPKETVLKGFLSHKSLLEERINKDNNEENNSRRIYDLQSQINLLEVTQKHYLNYNEQKRLDVSSWREDYKNINK